MPTPPLAAATVTMRGWPLADTGPLFALMPPCPPARGRAGLRVIARVGLAAWLHACTHAAVGSWGSLNGGSAVPPSLSAGAGQQTGAAPPGAPARAPHHQLVGPAAVDRHPLAAEAVAGARVAGDGLTGPSHRGHVVALAGAGGADAGEEGWAQPVGLPLLALVALLEAVVLEQPVELAGDGGEVAQHVPIDVDASLVAQLLEEPAAEKDVAEPLQASVLDHRPQHPVDDPEVVLVGLLAAGGVVDLALPARFLEVEQGALEGLAGVLARLLPAEVVQQPVLGEGHRRGGGLLQLQPARAEPDDCHVAVAANRWAGGLADRAQAVGDRHPGRDLEALAGARTVGEAVLERLLEPAQVVGLAEGELGLGAADGDLLAGRRLAAARAGARAGQGRGGAGAGGGGGDGQVLRVARTSGLVGEQATGVTRSRRGRAAKCGAAGRGPGSFSLL